MMPPLKTQSKKFSSGRRPSGWRAQTELHLHGRLKLCCMQLGFLPRLMWPLTLHEAPLSKVETLGRLISSYVRKWLGPPRCLSSMGLCGRGVSELPTSSLSEEYKCAKVRLQMMLMDSRERLAAVLEGRRAAWTPSLLPHPNGRQWHPSGETRAEPDSPLQDQTLDCWAETVDQRLCCPAEIKSTSLRPDLVLWSTSLQFVYIIRVTVPWQEAVEVRRAGSWCARSRLDSKGPTGCRDGESPGPWSEQMVRRGNLGRQDSPLNPPEVSWVDQRNIDGRGRRHDNTESLSSFTGDNQGYQHLVLQYRSLHFRIFFLKLWSWERKTFSSLFFSPRCEAEPKTIQEISFLLSRIKKKKKKKKKKSKFFFFLEVVKIKEKKKKKSGKKHCIDILWALGWNKK